MKGYLSVKETARKWNVSGRWVNQYIQDGRIPGVERFGKSWAIPEDAARPEKQKPGVKKTALTDQPSFFNQKLEEPNNGGRQ